MVSRQVPIVIALCLLSLPIHGGEARSPSDYTELDLQQLLSVVVTPTKQQQSPEEAPAVVAVITCRDIQRYGYRTVADALRSVSGMAVIDDHVSQHLGIRGLFGDFETPNATVKIMINGQPVSFRPTAGGFLGLELIPIDAVKRIEVLRGPGSALYGANAFLGVVNIITFDGSEQWDGGPADPGNHRHAVIGEGSYAGNEYGITPGAGATVVSGGAWGKFRYFAAASYHWWDRSGLMVPGINDMIAQEMHQDSPEQFPAQAGYPSPGWSSLRERLMTSSPSRGDTAQTGSFYVLLEQHLSRHGILSLDTSLQYANYHGEWQEYSYLTHENRLTCLNWFLRTRYRIDPGERGFGLDTSVAFSTARTPDDHLVDPLAPGSFKRRRFGYTAVDVVLETRYRFAAGTELVLGADYTADWENLLTMEVTNKETGHTYREPGFGNEMFHNLGLFLQGTWTPVKALSLTVGTRGDYNSIFGCNSTTDWACVGADDQKGILRFSNRAGATWQTGWQGLYLKAMYGSSYRPPSPYQLYHNRTTIVGSQGNPDLLPQTADTVEVVLGIKPTEGLHIYMDGYITWVNDMVFSYLEGDAVQIRNADALVYGLEGAISYTLGDRLSLFVNASHLIDGTVHPKRLSSETDLLWETSLFNDQIPVGMFPDWMGNSGITVHVPEGRLHASLLLHVIGKRRASITNNLLYNNTSLHKTYTLNPYMAGSLVVTSEALEWLGMRGVISAGLRYTPGGHVDPGRGGLDLPAQGPRLFLRYEHRF